MSNSSDPRKVEAAGTVRDALPAGNKTNFRDPIDGAHAFPITIQNPHPGLSDVLETLYDLTHSDPGWRYFPDFLESLSWLYTTAPTEIVETLESWLHSDDPDRVRAALSIRCTIPVMDLANAGPALDAIVNKWPTLIPEIEMARHAWNLVS